MRIADGVQVLELAVKRPGSFAAIHPVLLRDRGKAVLVDAGGPGQLAAFHEAMERAGVPVGELDRIVLTHQDIDQFGNVPQLLRAADHPVEVLAHEADRPYIEGEKPLIKWNPETMAGLFAALPEDRRQEAAFLLTPPRTNVDKTLTDGQLLPHCGGVTVLHTPGHTPGHISLYMHRHKILIAGDALTASNGRLSGPNPHTTPDMATAWQSLRKLAACDVEIAVCYHGGVCGERVNRQLAELAYDCAKA